MRSTKMTLLLTVAATMMLAAAGFAQNPIPSAENGIQQVACTAEGCGTNCHHRGGVLPRHAACGEPNAACHHKVCQKCGNTRNCAECRQGNCFEQLGSRRLPLHPQGLQYQQDNGQQGAYYGYGQDARYARQGYGYGYDGRGYGYGQQYAQGPSQCDDWWFLRPREQPVFGLNPLVPPTQHRPCFRLPFGGRVFGQHPVANTAPLPDLPGYTLRGPRDFFLDNPPSIGY